MPQLGCRDRGDWAEQGSLGTPAAWQDRAGSRRHRPASRPDRVVSACRHVADVGTSGLPVQCDGQVMPRGSASSASKPTSAWLTTHGADANLNGCRAAILHPQVPLLTQGALLKW